MFLHNPGFSLGFCRRFPKHDPELLHAVEEGGNQKGVSEDPGEGACKAGREEAKDRNQAEANQRSCSHLADSGEDGEGGKSHALDGETDNVYQGERDVEEAVGCEEGGNPSYDFGLVGIHEKKGNVFAAKEQKYEGDHGIDHADQACGHQSFLHTV